MRRSVTIALSLLFAAGATVAGVATAGASSASSAAAPKVTVQITSSTKCMPKSEFCYKPSTVTVAPGTRVTFVNKTLTTHTITRCTAAACAGHDGGTGKQTGFGSTVAHGAKYSFVFRKAGTYVYYCQIHGYGIMHGAVTVSKA
ncbi:MAG TPA: plastocyanin/azurin family copper-binding protein [Acidimicrobiia bacterium]|jgi:plastocyanin|nr:plastocyanin/azurin family copper-binding protein [Acidimicrobiia bacterium]